MNSRKSLIAISNVLSALAATVVVGVGAVGSAGCSQAAVASTGPQTPRPAAAGTIAGPFVQAGAVFSTRMDSAIDTFYTAPGTWFSATVVNPLVDNNGHIAVPYGAKVHGQVEVAGTEESPRLRVRVDSIDTVSGTLPAQVAVRHAQHVDWAGPARILPRSSSWDADAYLNPSDFATGGRPGMFAGTTGAPFYATTVRRSREVRVPQNATVEFVLVHPLVLPATAGEAATR